MSVVATLLDIPTDITENEYLNNAIVAGLPPNYDFEIHKTIWRIRQAKAKNVVLQFPEGLLLFAPIIADIIETFTGASVVIMGDPTYGACCIGDGQASALGADFLVHYGHSCLMSIKEACVQNMMYIFVHVSVDAQHFTRSIAAHLPRDAIVSLFATVQFAPQLRRVASALCPAVVDAAPIVARRAPLSGAEVLGCTAPVVDPRTTHMVFLADGRFHIEAALIANPQLPALRYCPLTQLLTIERYDHVRMLTTRLAAVTAARATLARPPSNPPVWGVVLGTLGRQGSPRVVDRVVSLVAAAGARPFVVLIQEIAPARLALLGHTPNPADVAARSEDGGAAKDGAVAADALGRCAAGADVAGCDAVVAADDDAAVRAVMSQRVDVWVQAACPRLSIDWGVYFATVPVLTPYECEVAVGATQWRDAYPMDHYAKDGGAWAYHTPKTTTVDDVAAVAGGACQKNVLPAAPPVVAPHSGGGRLRPRPAVEVC